MLQYLPNYNALKFNPVYGTEALFIKTVKESSWAETTSEPNSSKDMTMKEPVLLIPVENQVRELDAKLLLACIAAKRNLTSIIGPKRKIENHIASFPRGIFLSKSLRIVKRKFFPISRLLGHEIVAWDEEALVHLPPETYFSRRLSPVGMEHVSHLFA